MDMMRVIVITVLLFFVKLFGGLIVIIVLLFFVELLFGNRDHRSYNQIRTQTSGNHKDYENKTSERNHLPPPPTYSINPSPFSPSSSSPKCPASSSKPQQPSPSPKLPTSLSKVQQPSSIDPYSTFPKPPIPKPPTPSCLSPRPPIHSPKSSPFSPEISSNSKQPQASSKPHQSSRTALRSSSKPFASSPNIGPTVKQILSPASSNSLDQKGKKDYVWVAESSIYAIPEDIKGLIKSDIVPGVLNKPLSPATYRDYFAALLYGEEFYHEKWPHFDVKNVRLSIHEASVHKNPEKNEAEENEKIFVEFDMASFPEDRPFLLSRDFVYVRPSGTKVEHFEGILHRIVKSSTIVVEFKDNFNYYHDPSREYDVSFSFNRVCLKRAHQAVQTASNALFQNFLFPDCISRTSVPTPPALLPRCHKLDLDQLTAVRHILSIQGSPPYLVSGHFCVERNVFRTSRTGKVVSEAVYQLCQISVENKILICAPTNRCCDGLMRSLMRGIPESDMFRANAAFREIDDVPEEILPSCLYENPYFSCPPIEKLQKFRVVFSTFMSSFRLHDKGLIAGHFSHIFLVDASSAIEPETLVPLTNFADEDTNVIVTGAREDRSNWVRSDIARKEGLKISYFERLFKSMPYKSLNPKLITELDR